jgi:hypothetical protein
MLTRLINKDRKQITNIQTEGFNITPCLTDMERTLEEDIIDNFRLINLKN